MPDQSNNREEACCHKSFLQKHPLRVGFITAAFVSLLIITVLAVLWHSYRNIKNAVLELSESLITQVSETVIEKTTNYLMPASLMSEMSSRIVEEMELSLTDNDRLEILAKRQWGQIFIIDILRPVRRRGLRSLCSIFV